MNKFLNLFIDLLVLVFLWIWQKWNGKRFFILADRYGRIGNQLYMSSFIIKWAKKYNAIGILAGLHPYDEHFKGPGSDLLLRFPLRKSICMDCAFLKNLFVKSINRISIRVEKNSMGFFGIKSHDLSRKHIDTGGYQFQRWLHTGQILFIRGFILDKTYKDIYPVHQDIFHYFQPHLKYCDLINEPFKKLSKSDIIVGVVIRHGDYKTWQNGKFYHPIETYVDWMYEVVALFKNKQVGFFIISDENQDLDSFKNFNYYFRAKAPIVNLYGLTKCDYIVGACSTFTAWGYFYGLVPHFSIKNEIRKLETSDFKLL